MKWAIRRASWALFLAMPLSAQGSGTITGTVFDSTAMAPLSGARVAVIGTAAMVEADDQGRFILEEIPVGTHPVTFFHPRLQELGISASSSPVEVSEGGSQTVALAIPSEATILRAWCAVEVQGPNYAPAAGFVRDSITGVGLPRATVTFSVVAPDGTLMQTYTARSEESGYYRVCNLPSGSDMRVVAMFGRSASPPVDVRTPGEGALFQDLEMVLTSIGEIRGKVVDYASRRPIAGARISVMGTDSDQLSDEDGEFFMSELPPGLHLLQTEYVGYATQVDSVTIFSDEAVLVEIPLNTNPIEIEGMTVTARARVGDPLTDLGRRADVLTRPQVDALMPRVRNMSDLISAAAFPGLSVREVAIDSGGGRYPGVCVEHNRVRRGGMGCAMITVFVDGMRLPDPASFLNDLNPVNVESVQLISPSEAALRYGNQGANGVLLISTRRGRN
jgi:hypothetical protein